MIILPSKIQIYEINCVCLRVNIYSHKHSTAHDRYSVMLLSIFRYLYVCGNESRRVLVFNYSIVALCVCVCVCVVVSSR